MTFMRIIGIVLIVLGIGMMAFNGFNFTTSEKVVDVGPIEINKEKSHPVSWPTWTGVVVLLAGVGLVVAGRKRS